MYQISGKITRIEQPQSGVSRTGTQWQRQSFLLESVNGNYIDRYAFDIWNMNLNIALGTDVVVTFKIKCREHNGKWYTGLECIDCKPLGAFAHESVQAPMGSPESVTPTYKEESGKKKAKQTSGSEDLPF